MIEHWLLDLAVEYPVRLSQIIPIVDTVGLNVKALPNCEAEDYARALAELSDSGAIVLSSEVPKDEVVFKLTSRGAEVWESIAEPRWSDILTLSADLESGELCSPNRNLIMAFMGWYEEIERQQIALETIAWREEVHPAAPEWSLIRPPAWFRDWYVSAIAWHKKPWDLPGWPQG